jgi:predicted alpha/beta-hydrolase family hydrolase
MQREDTMKARHDIQIPIGKFILRGELRLPKKPSGMVVFAHGSGTTRRDPLHQAVARKLARAGFATLVMELLDEYEMHDRHNVFDVGMQAERLVEIKRWLAARPRTQSLNLGYFGTGVGTGAVLIAAAKAPQGISAIVCAGGRPDTALCWLPSVTAPMLFIDAERGSKPDWVESAYLAATAEKELVSVPSPDHLLKEPRAISAVVQHACRWFTRHLAGATKQPAVRERKSREQVQARLQVPV